MIIKKSLLLFLPLLLTAAVNAAETVVWQGTKKFSGWGDVLNIGSSKLSGIKADNVLHFSITASSGAQLQLSWGSSWTYFDGLEHKDINGDFELLLTAQDATRARQGIHIKGVNFTLTAVTLKSNDGQYETEADNLFGWNDMLMSGATQGQTCTIGLKAYGGAGWYWPEPIDLSTFGSIVINLLQPAAEAMTIQLFYGEKGVKSQAIAKGATQCKLAITAAHKQVYSLNVISEKAQTVALGSVNLADKQGNIVSTGIDDAMTNKRVLSVEYYNTSGMRLDCQQRGINIIKTTFAGGRTVIRKVIK